MQTGDEIGFGASLNSIFTSLSEFRSGWWIRQQSSAYCILNSDDCGVHADQCVEENAIAPGVAPDISIENYYSFQTGELR